MKSPMQHSVRGAAWLAPLLVCGACTLDLPLGDLSEDDASLLDDGTTGPSGGSSSEVDGVVDWTLPPPGFSAPPGEDWYWYASSGRVDLDGDGFDELAVVRLDESSDTEYVHIRYGGPRSSDEDAAFTFRESGAKLIVSRGADPQVIPSGLFAAGDVDGDGYGDLFFVTSVCGPAYDTSGGYLIYGGPQRLQGLIDIASVGSRFVPPAHADDASGCDTYSFGAGDLDGDGLSDLVFAHPGPPNTDPPAAATGNSGISVFYGRSQRFPAQTPWADADARLSSALSGDPERERDDIVVSVAGDLDGDGRAELGVDYVSADGNDWRVILVPGSAQRWTGQVDLLAFPTQLPSATLRGARAEYAGCSLTGGQQALGDVDGDGFDDLLVAFNADPNSAVFYGAADLLAGPLDASRAAARLEGSASQLLPLGDLDGDGDAELGALRYVTNGHETLFGCDLAISSGSRARWSGSVPILPPPLLTGPRLYEDDFQRFALSVTPVGDVDGDGAGDVMTTSELLYDNTTSSAPFLDRHPLLHIHYGVPVGSAPGAVDGPR